MVRFLALLCLLFLPNSMEVKAVESENTTAVLTQSSESSSSVQSELELNPSDHFEEEILKLDSSVNLDSGTDEFQTRSGISRAATRVAPQVPGPTEDLDHIFRNPIGNGTELLNSKVLQITPDVGSKKGAIWSLNALDLREDFTIKAYIYLGNSGKSAGDGITFTLQNDPKMGKTPQEVIGSAGFGIGAYGSGGTNSSFVENALSIEFDTYYNNGDKDPMDGQLNASGTQQDRGHVAFVTPKKSNKDKVSHHSWKYPSNNLSNGKWRNLEIRWEAATGTLSYMLDDVPTDSYTVPNIQTQFGGTMAYWGFTGSTGGKSAENLIAISELPQEISQQAEIENLTEETGLGQSVIAKNGERLKLKSNIKISGFPDPASYSEMVLKIKSDNHLLLDPETVEFNQMKVSANQIEIVPDGLLIRGLGLSTRDVPDELSIEGTITDSPGEEMLTASFIVLDKFDKELNESSILTISVPKIETGKVTVKYLDEADQEELLPDYVEVKNVDEEFDFSPTLIEGYEYSKTVGNSAGEFTKEDQIIIFYYRSLGGLKITSSPDLIDFGKVSIRDYQAEIGVEGSNLTPLTIEDSRKEKKSWKLTAKILTALNNGLEVEPDAFRYVYQGKEIPLTDEAVTVYANETISDTSKQTYQITDSWGKSAEADGLKIKLDSGKIPKTAVTYAGEIEWSILEVIE